MTSWDRNGHLPAESVRRPSSEALELFAGLAAELEEGSGDPEALFEANPELESELRRLYRGWLEADALLRGLAGSESLVDAVRRDLQVERNSKREDEIIARLADTEFERRYELGEELGHGGMGLVRRVTDKKLGRELAMKLIRPVDPSRRRRLLGRFLEEAEVIGRMEHPGIVPIHDLGLDSGGQVYFTMPLVRGRTLQEILRLAREKRESWTRMRVLDVLLKVCDAVAYAHSRGVLHRDLKPANVMVGRFGEVYVMDWGLARSVGVAEEPDAIGSRPDGDALTLEGEVLGTPAYMAPEQAHGRSGALDERCDVYALGAILYELLAGVRPYGECSSAEALAQLRCGGPLSVRSVAPEANEELCAISARAMARDPEERYPSVAALSSDLRAYVEGRVVRAHRTGPWIEAKKWVQRNRRLAAALSATVLALAAGLVASLVFLRRAEHERANVFRLAQTRKLSSLLERAAGLWPAHPDKIDAMRAWQREALVLVATLDKRGDDPGLRHQLAALAANESRWDEEDRWWHDELAKLVTGIEELADPERGLLGKGLSSHGWGIGRRLALAESLQEESERPEIQARWREAQEALRADPRFAGVEIRPRTDLVPIGRDPESGLLEFAHPLTGAVPTRGADGRIRLDGESGLVLVLVPGGESWVGAQHEDPNGRNYVPFRGESSRPLVRVVLEPFLLSKYEMTQGQWQRATGTNPSLHREPEPDRLPVEQVTWFACHDELSRAGLRLPREDEWEHAARAGSSTLFSWGNDLADFPRHANVRDLDLQDQVQRNDPFEPARDGYANVAPVGSYLPNAWGFHDCSGNVMEWCEDVFPNAGNVQQPESDVHAARIFRGGSFQRILEEAHPGRRGGESPLYAYRAVGVRPAADLRVE